MKSKEYICIRVYMKDGLDCTQEPYEKQTIENERVSATVQLYMFNQCTTQDNILVCTCFLLEIVCFTLMLRNKRRKEKKKNINSRTHE